MLAFAVSSDGRSGGFGMFWNNERRINILGYSQYHIDTSVLGLGSIQWRLTSVYCEAQTSERYKTWNTLKDISSSSSLPWLCLGDFNEVLRPEEHQSVGTRSLNQMHGFRDVVDLCNLINLGYKGHVTTQLFCT
jgi:hypothetical protein